MSTTALIPVHLTAKAKELALPDMMAADLLAAYAPHAQACAAIRDSRLIFGDPLQPDQARRLRLDMLKVRTASDRTRKALKADVLLRGRAIDGLHALVEIEASTFERDMESVERAAERAEAARVAALRVVRLDALRPYVSDPDLYPVEHMEEAAFGELLSSSRVAAEARARTEAEAAEAASQAAESARLAEIAAEAARIAEVERLQADATKAREEARIAEAARLAAEAEARAVREAAERAARQAREEARVVREAAEREAAAETARVAALEAERVSVARAAERAPDADKIRALSVAVRALALPSLSAASQAEDDKIRSQAAAFAAWLDGLADTMAAR